MFPDHTGSDVDYYERLNPQDPGDWCPHGVDLNEAGCWTCIEEKRRLLRMAAMTDEMLARIQRPAVHTVSDSRQR